MPDICIRKVPEDLHRKLKKMSYERHTSMQEVLMEALQEKCGEQPDLFDMLPVHLAGGSARESSTLPFRFIDLFAGVGGFRIAMERLGGRCVFSSEWDPHAQKTYSKWHGDQHLHGDITKVSMDEIPLHDILCAGFPCQPFSLAGVSKKNSLGRQHGFLDQTQGTLFFHLGTIASIKRPPIMILENVKNLVSHDGGRTMKVIEQTLRDLDYVFFHKVIDARPWVPQHRERIIIVCFDSHTFGHEVPFKWPVPPSEQPKLRDILEKNPDMKYTLSDHLWKYLQDYAAKHKEAGNGFGYGLADLDGCSRTLSARYHKDGSEILIPQAGSNPRRLTPRECARLMGYPDDYKQVVSDTQAYRQFGNSVVPAVIEAVGREVLAVVNWHVERTGSLLKARNPYQRVPELLVV